MIIVKPWALFRADFPSDMVDKGHGEPVHGGRNVLEAIGEILRSLDCAVGQPVYAGEHGWFFIFQYQRKEFSLEVSEGWGDGHALHWDPPLLISSGAHLDVMLKLNERLQRDGRFHEIGWYDDDDVGSAKNGCPLPVLGELTEPSADLADLPKLSLVEKLLAPLRRRSASAD